MKRRFKNVFAESTDGAAECVMTLAMHKDDAMRKFLTEARPSVAFSRLFCLGKKGKRVSAPPHRFSLRRRRRVF